MAETEVMKATMTGNVSALGTGQFIMDNSSNVEAQAIVLNEQKCKAILIHFREILYVTQLSKHINDAKPHERIIALSALDKQMTLYIVTAKKMNVRQNVSIDTILAKCIIFSCRNF